MTKREKILAPIAAWDQKKRADFGEWLLTILLEDGQLSDYPVLLESHGRPRELCGGLEQVLVIARATDDQLTRALELREGRPRVQPGLVFQGSQKMRVVSPCETLADSWWCEGVEVPVGLWASSAQFILNRLVEEVAQPTAGKKQTKRKNK